jgi:hypothetical protein
MEEWRDGGWLQELNFPLGNFAKASTQNLNTVLDATVVGMLDNNSTHMWNTMSFYWKNIVASPGEGGGYSSDSS